MELLMQWGRPIHCDFTMHNSGRTKVGDCKVQSVSLIEKWLHSLNIQEAGTEHWNCVVLGGRDWLVPGDKDASLWINISKWAVLGGREVDKLHRQWKLWKWLSVGSMRQEREIHAKMSWNNDLTLV